jgi:hypothetical protein
MLFTNTGILRIFQRGQKCFQREISPTNPLFANNIYILFHAKNTDKMFKGTWQRGGFSGVFAEIGSA